MRTHGMSVRTTCLLRKRPERQDWRAMARDGIELGRRARVLTGNSMLITMVAEAESRTFSEGHVCQSIRLPHLGSSTPNIGVSGHITSFILQLGVLQNLETMTLGISFYCRLFPWPGVLSSLTFETHIEVSCVVPTWNLSCHSSLLNTI